MKPENFIISRKVTPLFAFVFFVLMAFKPSASSETTILIKGTSSLHDWECTVGEVQVNIDALWSEEQIKEINGLEVIIPVKSIESGKNLMNKKLYKALKADDYANIHFKMTRVLALKADDIKLKGLLTIAGESKPIELRALLKKDSKGYFVEGGYSLKMSEYNVEPPEALMGTIKTGDEIRIEYKTYLKESLMSSVE